MASEEELIASIADAQFDLDSARSSLAAAKRELRDAESKLTGCKLKFEILSEELRVIQFYKITHEVNEREKEIADFKARMPELMERIK
jgi:hypothetical protein